MKCFIVYITCSAFVKQFMFNCIFVTEMSSLPFFFVVDLSACFIQACFIRPALRHAFVLSFKRNLNQDRKSVDSRQDGFLCRSVANREGLFFFHEKKSRGMFLMQRKVLPFCDSNVEKTFTK